MVFEIGIYKLNIDVEQTAAFYKNAGGIGCDCDGCRNYSQAVRSLPPPVQQFLVQFGVDPAKPAEVYVNYAPSKDTAHYGGFYHICGTILEGTEPWVQADTNHYILDDQYNIEFGENLSVFITERVDLLEDGFPRPAIQIEIAFALPWVLDEPNSYL